MKTHPTFAFLALFFALLSSTKLYATDTLLVDPGVGTLQDAINQNGGDVIYQLQAGEYYILDGIINVIPQILRGESNTLTIIGEETEGRPAVIQVGRDGNKPFSNMFNCSANLTLKNLFLSDMDVTGEFGSKVFTMNAKIRLVIDRCVIDPAGTNRTFAGGDMADRSSLFLTNSQIYRNGHMQGPNDGGWLGGMSWDTLWVENNTLVSSGQDFIGTPFHNAPNNQFIWINHNTFLWHDVWVKKSLTDQNFYFTNNLMHDISLFPELPGWYKFFPDFESGNTMLCQMAIDTLETNGVPEALPSERISFWEYNLMYYSPEIQEVPKYAADNDIELTYLIPMLWDENVPLSYTGGIEVVSPEDSCRENQILADKASWPKMKYNHNWYDLDPLYNDSMIYSINDSAGQHLLGFYRGQFWEEPDAPTIDQLPSYNWDIDGYMGVTDTKPVTWPRFDGTYHNADLLTASQEGLPLGDLNWYPEEKFQWYANKGLIQSHVLELNEDRFALLDPDSIFYAAKFAIVGEDNNPIMGAVLLVEGDTIGISNRYGTIEIDTLAGSYAYTCSAHAYEEGSGSFTIAYSSTSKTITLRSTVGIKALKEKEMKVSIYPNPAGDYLYISGEDLTGARIQIINLMGAIQMEELSKSDNTHLTLEDVSDGLYIIRIIKESREYHNRIIIQH